MRPALRYIQWQTRQTAPSQEKALQELAAIALRTKKRAAHDKSSESRSERFKLTAKQFTAATPKGLNRGHFLIGCFGKSNAPPVILCIAVGRRRKLIDTIVDIPNVPICGSEFLVHLNPESMNCQQRSSFGRSNSAPSAQATP